MNKKLLIAILISAFLIIAVLPTTTSAPQPPVNANVLNIGTIGLPSRLSPWDADDTASAQLIMNVYDTLITFGRRLDNPWPVAQQPDPREQGLVGEFVPSLATALPTVVTVTLGMVAFEPINPSEPNCTAWEDIYNPGTYYHLNRWKDNYPDGIIGVDDVIYVEKIVSPIPPYEWIPCTKYAYQIVAIDMAPPMHIIAQRTVYYFPIRTGVTIHDWKDQYGALHSGQILTPQDVEWSLECGLITDKLYGPQWMLYKPLFDEMTADPWWGSIAEQIDLGKLIMCAIQSNSTHVWISTGINFPEVVWYQILSQTWTAIVPRAFGIDHGCWNGTFFDNVANPTAPVYSGWRRWPSATKSPLDLAPTVRSPYDSTPWFHNFDPAPTARGTGPYQFAYLTTSAWRIDQFLGYWKGWTDYDNAHPYHVSTVICTEDTNWPPRVFGFLIGSYDIIYVPRANMREILIPPAYTDPWPGIVCYNNIPTLQADSLHFNFNMTGGDMYHMPTIGGVPVPEFFNNVYARRAFAYSLNFTQLIENAWYNEANQPATWYIAGLTPDYRDPSIVPYNYDPDKVRNNLQAAMYNGTSLWDSGFKLTLYYNSGNDQRRIVCQMIKQNIEALNALRPDLPPFDITVNGIWWDVYIGLMEAGNLPIFISGWRKKSCDADDGVRTYMHSDGYFASIQGYSNATVDAEIDLAAKTPNGPLRLQLYYDLQNTFIDECPSVMIVQPVGRIWMRHWVQGWYYNPLFPGCQALFADAQICPFYDLWKGFTGDLNRDLLVDIFDLVIVAAQFGRPVDPPLPIDDLRADVNKDGIVDIFDIVIPASQFGWGSSG